MDYYTYAAIGYQLGRAVGWLTFAGSWIYCIATYGFLLGEGIGWLPSLIVGALAAIAVYFLWAPLLLVAAVGLVMVFKP